MNVIILRYGELHLKGHNRGYFENTLIANIKKALSGFQYTFEKTQGRYIVSGYPAADENALCETLSQAIGLHSLSRASYIKSDFDIILSECAGLVQAGTFRITCNRADKTFPLNSMQLARTLGGKLLELNPNLSVDLHNPQTNLHVDMRENGHTFVYDNIQPLYGGLPVGTGGKGLVLLSGGIDSPVAAFLMAKRGVKLSFLHFHSYPYTSAAAKEKVLTLVKRLTSFAGSADIYLISFTEIQEEIHKNCDPSYMITLMRRIMMRIAEAISENHGLDALITGESLGQVASQTVQSITVTNSVLKRIPALRPLIGSDKNEIIKIAREIGTYETSILPYEDCCTVFLPENPVIKPSVEKAEFEETKLNLSVLIDKAIAGVERLKL